MNQRLQSYHNLISDFLEENKIVYSLSEYAISYAKAVPSACLEVSNKLTDSASFEYIRHSLESRHQKIEGVLRSKIDTGEYSSEERIKDVRLHAELNLLAKILEAADRQNLVISPERAKFNDFGFYF